MTEAERERAAVVAWLRENADGLRRRSDSYADRSDLARSVAASVSATAWLKAAAAIERGEHLTNEGK